MAAAVALAMRSFCCVRHLSCASCRPSVARWPSRDAAGSLAPALAVRQPSQHRTWLRGARCKARSVTEKIVTLASTWTSPERALGATACVAVLLHGLDAWRATWLKAAAELAARGIASLAVDLRGHGESPLGETEDFGPCQMAADVRAAVRAAGLPLGRARLALVGHSMGGRVAMRYAAEYPNDLAALVIEDMDCVPRELPTLPEMELHRRRIFRRSFPNWASCREALLSFGYAERRVDFWRDGRPPGILPRPGRGVWSTICPHAQHLAMANVLASSDGLAALREVAGWRRLGRGPASVHALVAGPKWTVCSWDAAPGGVLDMRALVPGLQAVEFPSTSHCIHRAASGHFADAVEAAILQAETAGPGPQPQLAELGDRCAQS